MSDDLGKKIKQITDILGQENLPDNLKGILSLLGAGGSQQTPQPPSLAPPPEEQTAHKNEAVESQEAANKMRRLMDRARAENDPRVNLLSAIRPFLNNTRQKRLNNCIELLQMSNMVRYMDENEK